MAISVAENAEMEGNSVIHGSETIQSPKELVTRPDDDLVASTLRGDRLASALIVEKHGRWIHALCSRILRSEDKARDATQEVFARALGKMSTLQDGARLAGWLKAIAVNQCRNVLEKERLYYPFASEEALRSPNLNPEQHLIVSENRELVGELIDRLPPKQRLVFVMKYIDEYTCRQIKELTGFSDKQVKSYLQNARRNFEESWTNRGKKK